MSFLVVVFFGVSGGFLEGLFGAPGSILASFWGHVCSLFAVFWRQVAFVKICTPLEREHDFRGAGGSGVALLSLFLQLRFQVAFLMRILCDFEVFWVASGSPNGTFWAPWDLHFGVIFDPRT